MIGEMIKTEDHEILKIMDKVNIRNLPEIKAYLTIPDNMFMPVDCYMAINEDGDMFKVSPTDIIKVHNTNFNVRTVYEYHMGDESFKLKYLRLVGSAGDRLFKNMTADSDQIITEFHIHKLVKHI